MSLKSLRSLCYFQLHGQQCRNVQRAVLLAAPRTINGGERRHMISSVNNLTVIMAGGDGEAPAARLSVGSSTASLGSSAWWRPCCYSGCQSAPEDSSDGSR